MDNKDLETKDFERELQRGEELFESGRLDEARIVFESLLQLDELRIEALNDLGTVLYCQGDPAAAEVHFMKAFRLNPNYLDVVNNLADLHFNLKNWDKAAHFLELYTAKAPLDKDGLNKLALAYMESGIPDKAVPVLKKSLSIDPDQREIKEIYGNLTKHTNARPRTSRPVLTIGLPVYNGERYLAQAIESALSQDFGDFELIISDNCSTDRTRDICLSYQEKDQRIKYYKFDENMGMLTNFLSVLGRSSSDFFMYTTYDDLREKSYVKSCLRVLVQDDSVALAHSRSKILDADSNFLGIAQDRLHADQDNPQERFRQVIWQLGMCNAFLGIFRYSMLKKVTAWGKTLFLDTLLLAEISLLGKIIQIEEPLFIRRLTRNYNYKSDEDRNSQLIADCEPKMTLEGINLPHCRMAYGHLEVVNQSALSDSEKSELIQEVKKCFRTRYGQRMAYEIDRAIILIKEGCYYHEWNKSMVDKSNCFADLKHFRISALLKRLEEARFFYPERQDLAAAIGKCQAELRS